VAVKAPPPASIPAADEQAPPPPPPAHPASKIADVFRDVIPGADHPTTPTPVASAPLPTPQSETAPPPPPPVPPKRPPRSTPAAPVANWCPLSDRPGYDLWGYLATDGYVYPIGPPTYRPTPVLAQAQPASPVQQWTAPPLPTWGQTFNSSCGPNGCGAPAQRMFGGMFR
jgi:hypothetical protein